MKDESQIHNPHYFETRPREKKTVQSEYSTLTRAVYKCLRTLDGAVESYATDTLLDRLDYLNDACSLDEFRERVVRRARVRERDCAVRLVLERVIDDAINGKVDLEASDANLRSIDRKYRLVGTIHLPYC